MPNFKAVILKGKNDIKKDGTTNIKIRIGHKSIASFISTDFFVLPANFNIIEGKVKKGKDKSFINSQLAFLLHKYQVEIIKLHTILDILSAKQIKTHLLKPPNQPVSIDFFEFIQEYADKTKVMNTRNNYLFLMASLKNFIGPTLPVTNIKLSFLNGYEAWLRDNGAENGIINYMKTFRSLFNKCRDQYNDEDTDDIPIPNYPFRKYNFPKRNTNANDHVLTVDELQMLINYNPKSDSELFAKDMFLLMFYLIGIESVDLFSLNKPTKNRAKYIRFKTHKPFSIFIEPEAKRIINRYKGKDLLLNVSERFNSNRNFFRFINNHLSGDKSHNIVGIFAHMNINKKVTTKWARHTWATIARNNCKINKDDVALSLGHKDLVNKVTDLYIKPDHSLIDSANKKVISFINS